MANTEGKAVDLAGIQVAVRVRPLNPRERDEGLRSCVTFDEPSRQVVLQAVDKETLMQLRGCTAKGFAFDRRFGIEQSSDDIYDSCVADLVENLFRGYNATVLAYGQTGSGKTHTMTGGVGIHGVQEQGITRRAALHIFSIVDALKAKLKPGEAISVGAYALELYNEDLRDLSKTALERARDAERRAAALVSGSPASALLTGGGGAGGAGAAAAAAAAAGASTPRERAAAAAAEAGEVRIAERPVGRDGRVVPEVVGVTQVTVEDAAGLISFFSECCDNRSVASTKMNDRSSRSHAIYTVVLHRAVVEVSEDGGKVRTTSFESKFHLVDLAGSERVKRSGVTGQAFKEATHINSGLLALGNVIVALSEPSAGGADGAGGGPAAAGALLTGGGGGAAGGGGAGAARRPHIPYRDSKLTRLLQDSLGGNSLTVLISCISSCEADFEETANTLKYANRACRIKNTPLPAKYTTLEEDLLPMLPEGGAGMGMVQIQSLLEDHAKLKEMREKREADKRDAAEKRITELRAMREAESKKPGYQRLRIMQYDELRRKLTSSQGLTVGREAVIGDETLAGFRKREDDDGESSPSSSGPSYSRPTTASRAAGGGSGRASPSPARGASPSPREVYTPRKTRPGTSTAGGRMNGSADGSLQSRARAGAASGRATPDVLTIQHSSESGAGDGRGGEGPEAGAQTDGGDWAAAGGTGTSGGGVGKIRRKAASADEAIQTSPLAGGEAPYLIKAWQGASAGGGGSEGCEGELPDNAGHEDAGTQAFEREEFEQGAAKATAAAVGEDAACGTIDEGEALPEAAAEPAGEEAGAGEQQRPRDAQAAGSFGPFVQLEFKPRPSEAERAAAEAAAAAAAAAEAEAEADAEAEAAAAAAAAPSIPAVAPPQLLARFRVNKNDSMAVFMAATAEDFTDVVGLLPANSALPASDRMSYLLGRLEVNCGGEGGLQRALGRVAAGEAAMNEAVGPAVGCLMATIGTSLITDCIFDFEDPEELNSAGQEQRLELWGLQIPHNLAVRPALVPAAADDSSAALRSVDTSSWAGGSGSGSGAGSGAGSGGGGGTGAPQDLHWSSADRLNVSVGLLYALCAAAQAAGASAGFCVPRPQLLKRWLQAGVKMRQVQGPAKLIYPPSAHDYMYYKGSTVAYFLVPEVKASLEQVLSVVHEAV